MLLINIYGKYLNSGKIWVKDKVIAGNGVIVDTTTFKEEINRSKY